MSSRGILRILAAAALICSPQIAFSQNSPGTSSQARNNVPNDADATGDKNAAKNAGPAIPKEVLDKIVAGDAGAVAAVRAFLLGGGRSPDTIALRATKLIQQIGEMQAKVPSKALLKVVDHVASSAISMVSGAQVIKLGIQPGFVPTKAVVAWDFGPPDAPAAKGFQKILPGDSRLSGIGINGLRRPGDDGVLSDGITGVERIQTDLPDGKYRIILMTQNLGDRKLMRSPFGSEVVVNGSASPVGEPAPGQWVSDAVLSNEGAQALQASDSPGSGAQGVSNGFVSGNLRPQDQLLASEQQGGAIIVPVTVRNGKLTIQLRGLQGASSYLTGLMIEPADDTSELIMSHQAMATLAPPELRMALEEHILSAAAKVLSTLETAAGNSDLVNLPPPVLDPQENASISG